MCLLQTWEPNRPVSEQVVGTRQSQNRTWRRLQWPPSRRWRAGCGDRSARGRPRPPSRPGTVNYSALTPLRVEKTRLILGVAGCRGFRESSLGSAIRWRKRRQRQGNELRAILMTSHKHHHRRWHVITRRPYISPGRYRNLLGQSLPRNQPLFLSDLLRLVIQVNYSLPHHSLLLTWPATYRPTYSSTNYVCKNFWNFQSPNSN